MFSEVVQAFFTVLLVVGVPMLSFVTAHRSDIRLLPRPALYLSAVVSQWFLALLGFGVVLGRARGLAGVGFRSVPTPAFFVWTGLLAGVALAALGLVLVLEKRGWLPGESDLVHLLLPETRREKFWSVVGLAPTAALCEEFLYRGFLFADLSRRLQSESWGWILSSAAFGLAHSYQGGFGVFRAALLGAWLGYGMLRLGSLYPSMTAHFLIDALAFAWLGPVFLKRTGLPPVEE